ncbi:hypothetical protein Tco_1010973, partial [Tanacetum coccineum]
VVKKLKSLKKPLRQLLYEKGNLHENVIKLRFELDRVQSDLDLDIMQILKQKSKVEWLRVGDSNLTYFYKSVKGRMNRNRIDVVTDLAGDVVTGDDVPAAFVSHYEAFLGQQGSCIPFDSQELFLNRLDSNQALDMIKNVTTKEIKDAIFLMGNDKSPGPDRYTACFLRNHGILWRMMLFLLSKSSLLMANC